MTPEDWDDLKRSEKGESNDVLFACFYLVIFLTLMVLFYFIYIDRKEVKNENN